MFGNFFEEHYQARMNDLAQLWSKARPLGFDWKDIRIVAGDPNDNMDHNRYHQPSHSSYHGQTRPERPTSGKMQFIIPRPLDDNDWMICRIFRCHCGVEFPEVKGKSHIDCGGCEHAETKTNQ